MWQCIVCLFLVAGIMLAVGLLSYLGKIRLPKASCGL